ncbi:MAG TPA: prephenate dehydrogenase/arogenate dehydrogenase family protein [Acidimicrobiales bacterium]|nr:prephenate dehydrogenase/arogenate dehydrogenase family protein [Acidimicrobiales bacterium]
MTSPDRPRAYVIGLGLIGASVALALAQVGWSVGGEDRDADVLRAALDAGVVDGEPLDDTTTLVVIATPASSVAALASEVLARHDDEHLLVTDVAGVKGSIVAQVDDARFVGGHPMAGSEQRGMAGARADMFRGCTWVLTPTARTQPTTYGRLHGILRDIGANVVAVNAADHDRLVALASHVPHLLAGALMNEAARAAEQDAVLLQLAAGGFRDMTRIAAGDPAIWPDVLFENRAAVVQTLASLETRLGALRTALEIGDRALIGEGLRTASVARRQLPGRAFNSERLAYLRVAVSDQPGVLASVTMAASELLVNIYDIEIAHGIEGVGGTLLLAVDADQAARLLEALSKLGFAVGLEP